MARKAKSLIPDIRWIAFGDLHVAPHTLDRCISVLQRVRALAVEHGAEVVFTGDFWDARGALRVRLLDAVCSEFDEWHKAGVHAVIIPGNHDQVSLSGAIHGVRPFMAYPNIEVATETIKRTKDKVAFIPWREEPEAQAAEFAKLRGKDWTVFAHAEVRGARTNHAHTAAGRVTIEEIENHSRACYLGHYHKRQRLGQSVFYLGSPYEQNLGERDEPHGVAMISASVVTPYWVDFNDFPKHHSILLSDVATQASKVRPIDIVELRWPQSATPDQVAEASALLPTSDVRPRPIPEEEKTGEPSFALTLDDALKTYADNAQQEAELHGTDLGVPPEELLALGRSLLAEVPGTKDLGRLGRVTRVVHCQATDFCALRGVFNFGLDKRGLLLIRGDQGAGKTAALDAVTWALFGQTTPRKAGTDGASLRADDVINDYAGETSVIVQLRSGDVDVTVRRSRQRGKPAKIEVTGIEAPAGISDNQELIQYVLGIDYHLWRSCVSLGQGAVANFLTSGDKRRKELLAAPFGLEPCPGARDQASKRAKRVNQVAEGLHVDVLAGERTLEALQAHDFTLQIAEWTAQQTINVQMAQQQAAQAQATIAECDANLAGEAAWIASKTQHEAHIAQEIDKLGAAGAVEVGALQSEIGALGAEKALTEAAAARDGQALAKALSAGSLACPTCLRPMDSSAALAHVDTLAKAQHAKEESVRAFDARLANATAKLEALTAQHSQARAEVERQLAHSRAALGQIGQALHTFERLRANRAAAETALADAQRAEQQYLRARSPWEAKQAEALAHRQALSDKLAHDKEALVVERRVESSLRFWVEAFGPKGIPVLVLRAALHDLEVHANRFMSHMSEGAIHCRLLMTGDDLDVEFFKRDASGKYQARRYEQLSGGERREVELCFSPFAFSELVFSRTGAAVPLMLVDELTTHLGQAEKVRACEMLRAMDRETVIVIDHDLSVQGEFDQIYDLSNNGTGVQLTRA